MRRTTAAAAAGAVLVTMSAGAFSPGSLVGIPVTEVQIDDVLTGLFR